jgi:hypothetical protein
MREFRSFLAALGRAWVALVSGGLGVLSAAVGIWGPASVGANRLFLSAGVVGIVYAAFLVWRAEHRRWRDERRLRIKQVRVYRELIRNSQARARLLQAQLDGGQEKPNRDSDGGSRP